VLGPGRTLAGKGSSDLVVARLGKASGKVLWAASAGGTSEDSGFAVATDGQGKHWVGGKYSSTTMTFNSTTSLVRVGSTEGFIARVKGP